VPGLSQKGNPGKWPQQELHYAKGKSSGDNWGTRTQEIAIEVSGHFL